jgi:hypothetical protein
MHRSLTVFFITLTIYLNSANSGRVFLVSKNEYKDLEGNNKLIKEAIRNIYGFAPGEEGYKLDIFKAEVSYDEEPFFTYFPDPEAEKKLKMVNSILKFDGLSYLTLRIKVNLDIIEKF